MTPNRIVVFLSPVFVGLAGWVVTIAARYLPGHPHLNSAELTAIFIAGALAAAGKVALWLKGWQLSERITADPGLATPPARSIVKRRHALPKPATRPE